MQCDFKLSFCNSEDISSYLGAHLNYVCLRKLILLHFSSKHSCTHLFLRGEWDVSRSQEHVSVGIITKRPGMSELRYNACECLLFGPVPWLWHWAPGEDIYLKHAQMGRVQRT